MRPSTRFGVLFSATALAAIVGRAEGADKFRSSGGGGYATAGTWTRFDSTTGQWVSTSKPTAADNAFFDAAADGGPHGTYTVTFSQNESCNRLGIFNDNVTLSIGFGRVLSAGPDFAFVGISGPDKSASLRITSGELHISNNLNIDRPTSVTVTGASSRLIIPSSTIWLGGFASNNPQINNALLKVENGGRVETTNLFASVAAPYRGDLIVTGAGSHVIASHPTLSAAVQIGAGWTSISRVELGGRIDSDFGTVGFDAGSAGEMTVTGAGSQWNCSKNLNVGRNSGSSGVLRLLNGATMTVGSAGSIDQQFWIGENVGSTGSVIVDGAGTLLTTLKFLDVGAGGRGTLLVSGGGRVVTSREGVISYGAGIADDSLETDSATITGGGSRWEIGTSLEVGRRGPGTLEIADGGFVTCGTMQAGALTRGSADIRVFGQTVGGGAASELNIRGSGSVGGLNSTIGGPATLRIDSPARVSVQTLRINPLGRVIGDGVIAGNVVSRGTIEPGVGGAATLSISGSLTLGGITAPPNETFDGLRMELLGSAPSQRDRVVVSGAVTLSGGLVLLRPASFEPAVGFSAELIRGATIDGMFDVAFGSPGPGKFYRFFKAQNADNTQSLMVNVESLSTVIGFAPTGETGVNGLPNRAATGDLNGDGFPDLAVVVPRDPGFPGDTGAVVTLVNNGQWNGMGQVWADPTAAGTYFLGAEPVAVRIADMNGASGADVVVAARSITPTPSPEQEDGVRLLLNTGSGVLVRQGFPGETVIDIGRDPRGIAIGNFDNDVDGTPDIAATSLNDFDNGQLVVRPQGAPSTNPSFLPPRIFPVNGPPGAVEPGGLDQPKDLNDLCVTFPGTPSVPDSRLAVFVSGVNSGGVWDGFFEAGEVLVGKRPGHVAIGDLNGDGAADAVTTNFEDGSVSVVLNENPTGPGAVFLSSQTTAVGSQPGAVTLADFDRDGDLDLGVVSRADAGTETVVRVLRNDADAAMPPNERPVVLSQDVVLAEGESPVFVTSADVDLDGGADLVTINNPSGSASGFAKAYLSTCVVDLDANGIVNTFDLPAFLGAFGSVVAPFTNGDANGDGVISTPDLIYLLGRFGGNGC